MSDRQNQIYGASAQRDARELDGVLGSETQSGVTWKGLAVLFTAASTMAGFVFFAWVNFGHLVLPPRLTFSAVFGERQGLTTGESERASARGRANAQNRINRETAQSEAGKQAVIIRETTEARARQEARVRATAISETARLEAAAGCIRQLRAEAAMRRAQCIGTGTAGGECDARGDLVEEIEPQCGSLALPSVTQNEGADQ